MEFQVRYLALFHLFSVIDNFEWFWMLSLYKTIKLILEFLKSPFLILHFCILHFVLHIFCPTIINELLNDVIYNMTIYAWYYSKCDQASDLLQQLEFASELESDLWDT